MKAAPKILTVQAPRDGLGVSQRGLLAHVVLVGRLKVQQLVVLRLKEPCSCRLRRALVAAELTFHGARDVHAAEVLDRVVADTFAKQRLPRVRERPKCAG